MIRVEGLVVKYGDAVAVDGISFKVNEGEIYGLLGPNGAGKTSTIKAMVGLIPYEGSISIFGKEPGVEAKNLIGYVPEEIMLFESLTPAEFFEFVASIRRLREDEVNERLEKLVSAFAIRDYMNTPIAALSMGTKKKVAVIAALLHNPKLLILDEPLNGLDAKTSRILKEIMALHVKNGGAIIFSTHIMEIAEKLCSRIAVINEGRIIAEGSIDELRKMVLSDGSLEDVFLKITGQESEVREILNALKV
jgi:ABC-2 type transport system ATP-binding protein